MGHKPPAFQFYPKDWLSSLQVLMMSPAHEGAYIRLLAYCWDSGDCSLPDDDEQLAVMSRLGDGWRSGASAVLRRCFVPHPKKAGFLTNPRLLQEMQNQAAWRDKSAKGGRKSAAQRADKQQDSKGGSRVVEPSPNRPVQATANTATASASASATASSSAKGKTPSTPLPEWLPAEAWTAFKDMRRAMKQPMTAKAEELMLGRLDEFRRAGHDPTTMLNQSILHNWKNIYEPKGKSHDDHQRHPSSNLDPHRANLPDTRDPAARARDIGEDIIARRRARWAAEDAAKQGGLTPEGQPGRSGGADAVALPGVFQSEDVR